MKLPWLKRFRLPEHEKEASIQALEESERILVVAKAINEEAKVVGESQRRLRAENHFGKRLTHIYQNRSAT